ncbi:protein tyrosine phosphatase 2 [Adoxophyes honmai entomopoxvirus 'L']|uniref:Protein tyrosine phosphatase 2 n=1 Tax=Adoxophyes honmai entomopoxvirus 'L' TaxID=1293540 RepID=A0A916KNZ0_9POXV|nr:protein tyrosine phosphatase 2 [Adoxophyes honmai entomopoxvirus 'L']CCU55391.1 protein tyrosine phosphatase 2 [Adoxophyes honmai entomopoxvirus 'L']
MNISKITNNIFLGGLHDYNNDEIKNYLLQHNIKSILTIWNYDKLDINYLNIDKNNYLYLYAMDTINQNILKYFDITYNFIKKKYKENKNILIHCYAGMSRSAIMVINFFMHYYDVNYELSENIIYNKRKIQPNQSFVYQAKLYGYYKSIFLIIYLFHYFKINIGNINHNEL